MSNPSVTREECENIANYLPANSGERLMLRDLARAHLALLDSSEQTIQATEKLAECLEKLKLFRTSLYHVMWSEVDAALAQYAALKEGKWPA